MRFDPLHNSGRRTTNRMAIMVWLLGEPSEVRARVKMAAELDSNMV
jgi:hypothetical protein